MLLILDTLGTRLLTCVALLPFPSPLLLPCRHWITLWQWALHRLRRTWRHAPGTTAASCKAWEAEWGEAEEEGQLLEQEREEEQEEEEVAVLELLLRMTLMVMLQQEQEEEQQQQLVLADKQHPAEDCSVHLVLLLDLLQLLQPLLLLRPLQQLQGTVALQRRDRDWTRKGNRKKERCCKDKKEKQGWSNNCTCNRRKPKQEEKGAQVQAI